MLTTNRFSDHVAHWRSETTKETVLHAHNWARPRMETLLVAFD